uniref:Neur_chan_LBD domain-containing protein n=1 Tax=Strongyloides venezuelensis TaxID=75913 RepID=A0A0K0EW10_STRVS
MWLFRENFNQVTGFLIEVSTKKGRWNRRKSEMSNYFYWSFIFYIIGVPLLNDFVTFTYEVIGINNGKEFFKISYVGGELIRPNGGKKVSDKKPTRVSRDVDKKSKKYDEKWGSYHKVDLPPWMEEEFLDTLDETDYLGPMNDNYKKRRDKRNFFIDPNFVYTDDEKASDENTSKSFRSLAKQDIPVTYRLHKDLLRFYRKGTRPVTHPKKQISVSMSVFLYQIIKLDAVKNTISLSGSFELVSFYVNLETK